MESFSVAVSGEGQWSDWHYAYGRCFIGVSGDFDATLEVQYSPDKGSNTFTVDIFKEKDGRIFEVPTDGIWIRIGCPVGGYISGTANIVVQR